MRMQFQIQEQGNLLKLTSTGKHDFPAFLKGFCTHVGTVGMF